MFDIPAPPLAEPSLVDPDYADEAAFVAELDAMQAAGCFDVAPPLPEDDVSWREYLTAPDDAQDAGACGPMTRIERLEWELWEAVDRDEAEAAVLAERAPAWLGLPPGGELATALEQVRCSVESAVALIEIMKAASRLGAWAESIRLAAIASFYRKRQGEAAESVCRYVDEQTGRPADPLRGAAAEIAAALRLSPSTVANHIDSAVRLTRDLQDTFSALRCGQVTLSKALCVLDATAHLNVDAQRQVEQRVLARAPRQTQTQLRASLRRAVARVDARGEAERHADAFTERACRKYRLPDGMAGLWITHRADRIEAAWTAVRSLADLAKIPHANDHRYPGHPPDDRAADCGVDRTAEQRRADVMMDVFEQILAGGADWLQRPLPNKHRRRPHIEVTIAATTLLGIDDDPAELAGYGPIPAAMARAIATDGTWRRLLTDPATGVVLEAATDRHDPGAQVSETLLARHPTCTWIGCTRAARDCDRDHGHKYRLSKQTTLADLRPYCRYHHTIKDDDTSNWTVVNLPDGTTRFTTPTGHTHHTTPPARGPTQLAQTSIDHQPPRTSTERDRDPPPF